ncbi:putative 3'a2rel-related protein [Trypanosoma conorhini]|uniref:Putative 3'a2rel-related protein n=1 Tax=Trypanosoma conorhini TaxID=83891 RepID=A0A422NZ17_9TRYP|nr:putative 3'a2rel-related protein [Trypanosoma conorhini]RNF10671.1 putative 3'a2rel-related protein [Trypanosoma conorhini]
MGRAIGGGEWLTGGNRLEDDAADKDAALLDVSRPVDTFDPILDEAEKHKKRRQRHRNLGDADSYNTDELDAEKDATADVTDGGALPRASGDVGAYDAATTRVWLKTLVSETGLDADGPGAADGAGAAPQAPATEQSGEAGASRQLHKAASSCGSLRQRLSSRTMSRGFDEMLATLAPPRALGEAFHEKHRAKRESPVVLNEITLEEEEFAEEEEEEEDEDEESEAMSEGEEEEEAGAADEEKGDGDIQQTMALSPARSTPAK